MDKQKRWQLVLILVVFGLTIYNILPTLFYYTKPLHEPVNQERAERVALDIIDRVDQLEKEGVDWLYSFCKLLRVSPTSIYLDEKDPGFFVVSFSSDEDAAKFRKFLPRAGSLIAFVPSQLSLISSSEFDPKVVHVERMVGVHLAESQAGELFRYLPLRDSKGEISSDWKEVVYDRLVPVMYSLEGPSQESQELEYFLSSNDNSEASTTFLRRLNDMVQRQGVQDEWVQNWVSHLFAIPGKSQEQVSTELLAKLNLWKARLQESKSASQDPKQEQTLALLERTMAFIKGSKATLKKPTILTLDEVKAQVKKAIESPGNTTAISLNGSNPFIDSVVIDWQNDQLILEPRSAFAFQKASNEESAIAQEKLQRELFQEVAKLSLRTKESFSFNDKDFTAPLTPFANTSGFLAFDLRELAKTEASLVETQVKETWSFTYPDLLPNVYPIRSFAEYTKQSPQDQKMGVVVYAPVQEEGEVIPGFKPESIYLIFKGVKDIEANARSTNNKAMQDTLVTEFQAMQAKLESLGFIGYPGSLAGVDARFSKDFIFEWPDYYNFLLNATREEWQVSGSKKWALLAFSDVEQRIMTENRIGDQIQEDLLRWRDDFAAAQVDLNPQSYYSVPKPTKNVYWQNLKLTMAKYFRGDERKVLKWGLDLSGGKSVRIGLVDHSGQPVTKEEDLKQTVNELYARINQLGVSERTIRIEDKHIVLEFPGSQKLSAADLVQASSMSLHVVNEKFGPYNPELKDATNRFLQEVWNEAVITNRKNLDDLNLIAWEKLGGDQAEENLNYPRSVWAELLFAQGLRIAHPERKTVSGDLNDTLSSVGWWKGEDYADWFGQTHPLMFVFTNYALQGSSLTDIQVGYDPNEGNTLSFGVKRSYDGALQGSPRDDFYTWTSQFSEDAIVGTPKEIFSQGKGWRMAVVLNDRVISSPSLKAALRDRATISGKFTQREINQLAADLKAGSLTFVPKILSENNISPELGKEERMKGIIASLVALASVVIAMIAYYRFAGIVASVAVIVNLLIMWGVLQTIGAAVTLPGIAGIVLTIGMAVDANVLVFERFKEEFSATGRLASSLQAGYRKAFSAIVDSNLTTIITALILIQFDSGPIKGFAVMIIIGILSSMFTALFMTRYFFAGWVKNPANKKLSMGSWLKNANFNFLGWTKTAVWISVILMVAGTFLFVEQRKTMFGMDFTGGYALTVEAEAPQGESPRHLAELALVQAGAASRDVQVRELNKPTQLKIQLGTGMDEKGEPFAPMADLPQEEKTLDQVTWVVQALEKGGLKLAVPNPEELQMSWSIMSGQFSDTMRWSASIALACALLAILLYITFRFEWKYAVGAVVGLVHDVILTLGVLAFFHFVGFPVQIDLVVVGALMTLIGYSLNDTIIIFDRIREEVKTMRKQNFRTVVNHALNVTLSRTLVTSGTTFLVLLALLFLGGMSIFAFSLVMAVGVFVGTLSSLFIAAPVMLYMHEREESKVSGLQSSLVM